MFSAPFRTRVLARAGTRPAALLLWLTLLLAPAAGAAAQSLPAPVVQAEWLMDEMGSPDLVVIHVGQEEAWAEGHIPGSRFVPMASVAWSRGEADDPDQVRLELPDDLGGVRDVLEGAGISDDSRVVVAFDENRVTHATRVLWTLQVMGLGERSALLDGGVAAWTAAGGELSREAPSVEPGRITGEPRLGLRVEKAWVLDHLDEPSVALVDARRAPFHTGEREEFPGRAGHIPGAGSLPIEELFQEDGRLLPVPELRALFAAAGVEEGDTVVAYCHIGQRASAALLAARLAGFEALLYDGSMNEWARDESLPLEQGGGH